MRSIESYCNTSDGIVDVMTHGARRVIRLSQTDVRRAREYVEDILPNRYSGSRRAAGVLAVAVFNKAADCTGQSATQLLTWISRKFGPDVVADFAKQKFGMTGGSPKISHNADWYV